MKALPILATCLALTACGNSTPAAETPTAETVTVTSEAPTQTMTDWKHQAADEVSATGDAMIGVGEAMQAFDLPSMRVQCTTLRASIDDLERELPSPDPQVNDAFNDSIDDFRSLSQLCMTITPGSSKTEMNAMGDLIDHGSQRMSDAFKLLNVA